MELGVRFKLINRGGKSVFVGTRQLYIFLVSAKGSINLNQVVESINKSFDSSNQKPLKALESSIGRVSGELTNLGIDIEIAALLVADNTIHAACAGGVQISILRKSALATILKSNDRVITASGAAQEGDTIILHSSRAAGALSDEKLRTIISQNNFESSTAKIEAELGSVSSGSIGLMNFSKQSQTTGLKSLYGRMRKPHTPSQDIIDPDPVDYKKHDRTAALRSRLRINKPPDHPPTQQEIKSRKLTLTIGAILLLLLLVSIGFGIIQKNRQDTLSVYEPALLSAISDLESAKELADISPARARDNYASSLQTAQKLSSDGVEDERLAKLLEELEDSEGKVLGTYKVDSQVFLDLPLLSDPFEGTDLFLAENTLLILDRNNKKIVSVELDSKRSEVVAGPSVLGSENEIFGYSDSVYTSSDGGIYEIDSGKENIIEKDWNGNFLSSAYAGNIYVLAKDDSNIFRFPAVTSGFGSKQNWLGEGTESDFSNIISWAIDGSMWLLGKGGKMFKYGLGTQQNFSLDSVPTSLQSATQIYTDENSDHIYILIPGAKQILVVDKEGSYVALYESAEIQFARDFAVSEGEGKIIILTGDKLYEIEARHLNE